MTPAALLSVCIQRNHPSVCHLARRLYTGLFPDAPDVLSVLRELLDEQPAYAAIDGAALASTSPDCATAPELLVEVR